uniref:Uncharacterized protein n=1 Tax=Anopheles darlingi TaxID=43151 RepID=A0A2M4DIJ8_ANODA
MVVSTAPMSGSVVVIVGCFSASGVSSTGAATDDDEGDDSSSPPPAFGFFLMIFLITRRTFTTGLLLLVSLVSATFAGSLPSPRGTTTILLEEEVRSSDDAGLFSFVVPPSVVDFSFFSFWAVVSRSGGGTEGVRTGEAREEPFCLISFGSTERSGVTERREEGFNDNRTPIGAPVMVAVLPIFCVPPPPSVKPAPRM